MLKESKTDISIAFKVYLEYKKAYISTFIVFLTGIVVLVFSSFFIIRFVILDNSFQLDEIARLFFLIIILIISFSILFLLLSYARTTFGLSNDIMSSGELFTEFRRSITYFKRYWLYFTLLTIPYALIIILDQLFGLYFLLEIIHNQEGNRTFLLIIKFPVYIIDLILLISFIEIFPSIIVVKNLKQCIYENFSILKQNTKRLFQSICIYYLVFRVPVFVIDITRILVVKNVEEFLLFNVLFLIFTYINAIIGIPILSLISTRVYNTTILDTKTDASEFDVL